MNNRVSAAGKTLVVKIGGSTLGEHDTALQDIAALGQNGVRVVVVHGGGAEITRWLEIHRIASRFVDGLRVTDEAAIRVVVAVLAGLVNKELVSQLLALGVQAAGLSGVDGALLEAEIENEELGLVGTVRHVNPAAAQALLNAGFVPVIAPVAVEIERHRLLNVNADTAAGEVAAALPEARLVFLTDVSGVLDGSGELISHLTSARAAELRSNGTLKGGMIPKVDACLRAALAGCEAIIVDGRKPHALRSAVGSQSQGTRVG